MVQDRVLTISLLPPTMVGLGFIVVLKEISTHIGQQCSTNHSSIVQDIALTPTTFIVRCLMSCVTIRLGPPSGLGWTCTYICTRAMNEKLQWLCLCKWRYCCHLGCIGGSLFKGIFFMGLFSPSSSNSFKPCFLFTLSLLKVIVVWCPLATQFATCPCSSLFIANCVCVHQ